MKKRFLLLLLAGFSLIASAQSDQVSFSLFLVGNAGAFNDDTQNKALYQKIVDYDQNEKGIIFLGDNISLKASQYSTGDFDDFEDAINYKFLESFEGPICFVPGRSDWANGSIHGKDMVKWSRKALYDQLRNKDVYIPEAACPGPVELEINDSLTIILFDTQWWLHPYDTRFGKCDIEDESDVWTALQDALRRNRHKQIVVAAYHPVISYGETGGRFPTAKSVMPRSIYRKFLGSRADLSHPLYKSMSETMKQILSNFPNVIYASAHEQNFQYIREENIHQLIGGSLTGGDFVKDKKTVCASREPGYTQLDFYTNGEVRLKFLTLNNPEQPLCEEILYTFQREIGAEQHSSESFPERMSFSASGQYERKDKSHRWLGENYRDIWDTPVNVKVFDIGKEKGGLEILKRGGGQQTHSIRLQAKDKHQYALRSLEKFVEGAMPTEMKNTFAVDLIQDNISASNPYAALPVATLADAAGVMHTNPQIVYIPNDNRLGEYKEDLADNLFLFEERPNGNWKDQASFGNSKKIIGTPDVIEETEDKHNHRVNPKAVLRARLFDTFINDWDRHDDQWRWASFKSDEETSYEPIPRDRDQAFYINQGFLPRLTSTNWLMPKIQGFAPLTPNMRGLTFNARFYDRAFLTEPDWEQWKASIKDLQTSLSDQVIEKAMFSFPEEVQPLCMDFTADILKKRRDNLLEMARVHYLLLAKTVSVVGTNEDELFTVSRKNDQETEVSVIALSDKKHRRKEIIYQRLFKTDETEEIRLYGLKGDDLFFLDGEVDKGIMVRIIGGKGDDTIQNRSVVKTRGKQTAVYDLNKNTSLQTDGDTKIKLSDNKHINDYDRLGFRYNLTTPGVFLGYNADDGIFLGGGPVFNQYLFRRHNKYAVMANYAALTGAFNFTFKMDSESEIKGIDHHFGLDYKAPGFALNYFGLGNHTIKADEPKEYFRIKTGLLEMDYALGYRFGETAFEHTHDGSVNESNIYAGVFLRNYDMKDNSGKFVGDFSLNGLQEVDLESQFFSGIQAGYNYSNLDKATNPERGIQLELKGKQYFDLKENYDPFLRLSADFRAYLSFTRNPRTVLAFRLGGEKVVGNNYPFLESAILGGKTNLRGFWTDRFYGNQSIYQNTEIRYKLSDFSSYILNGELGILGFYDSGRVWHDSDLSGKWHSGYGGGFWMSPFEMTILTITYNTSKENSMIQLTMNFKF